MLKRYLIVACSLLTFGTALADAPVFGLLRVEPTEVPVLQPTVIHFTARVASDKDHPLSYVKLTRLQWSGNDRAVARMYDNGSHGDQHKNDGLYSCTLKLKEPIIGILSFKVEVRYKGARMSIMSDPMFVNVVGG